MAIDTETMQLIERIVARSIANSTSLKGAAGEIAKGVTQYVGARYVPIFAEPLEWDKTRAYEPLTIVLYRGHSYTSRQYVPVGVELTNGSFWAETGNYNAQVEQYRQEVKNFDGRITANANAIETETTNRTAAVTAEMERAQSAERVLQANIDAEKTRAESAGQTLQANIDAEKTRAESAEQTLQGKIDDITCYVNVKSYGVSESNEDNADAFQQAVDDTAEKGLILYIPKGTYRMSHKISLPWNCAIVGQSKTFSVLKFASDSGLVADIEDKNNYESCVGAIIRNITIEGSYTGYATAIYDKPWYPNRNNFKYMAFNYSGLGGWFTVCDIYNVRITKFVVGLCTYQPNFSIDIYNNLYNNIYGDLRMYRNIDVSYCNGGIFLKQADAMLDGFIIDHCYALNPIGTNGGFVNNGHSWATDNPWYIGSGTMLSNIEIESQTHRYLQDGKTQFDSCVLIDSTNKNEQTVITNLRIWNLPKDAPTSGTYHAPIRLSDNATEPCMVIGASFGKNEGDSTGYPVSLLETHGTNNPTLLVGSLSSQFTEFTGKTTESYPVSGNAPVYMLLLSSNTENMPKGFQNKQGYNVISTDHI